MIINQDSWHYRLYTKWTGEEPTNLCRYFWKIVGIIFILSMAVIAFSYILGLTAYSVFTWNFSGIGRLLVWFVICVLVSFLIEFITDRITTFLKKFYPRSSKDDIKTSFSKVVKEFVKSKKAKVCPTIEVR